MIKSLYSDPTIQDRGFVKHIHHVLVDMGVYPNDHSARLVELYSVLLRENVASPGAGGGKPRNIELYRKALGPNQDPSTGQWQKIAEWREGIEYDDASASGSVSVDLLTGQIHVALVFGKVINGALRFQPWEQTIERAGFAPAIVRLPDANSDPALAVAVAQLQHTVAAQQQQIVELETALGNVSSGGLSAADRSTLDWAQALRNVIGMA